MSLERDELERCYLRLEKPLFNVLLRWLWDEGECQDLMHDSFMRVWAQRRHVDSQRLDSLIYATALNLARNRLRWRRVWNWTGLRVEDQATTDPPDVVAQQAFDAGRLRRALESLPDEARNVVLLSEFAGMSNVQIAAVLGVAAGTIGSRKHRAMERLRGLLLANGYAASPGDDHE